MSNLAKVNAKAIPPAWGRLAVSGGAAFLILSCLRFLLLLFYGAPFRVVWTGVLSSYFVALVGWLAYLHLSRKHWPARVPASFLFTATLLGMSGPLPNDSKRLASLGSTDFTCRAVFMAIWCTTVAVGMGLLWNAVDSRRNRKTPKPEPSPLWDADADGLPATRGQL